MTLPQVLEALLFASPAPLTLAEIRALLKSAAEFTEEPAAAELARCREQEIINALAGLSSRYRQNEQAFELAESAAGWQLKSVAGCAPWVRQLFPESRPTRLSAPALETLAIIAYRQPLARADVEAVRGVDAGGVVQTLLDRGLVRIAGRAELPGRPLLYATTERFLEHFGLKHVNELPAFEELREKLLAREEPAPAAAADSALTDGVPEKQNTPDPDPVQTLAVNADSGAEDATRVTGDPAVEASESPEEEPPPDQHSTTDPASETARTP